MSARAACPTCGRLMQVRLDGAIRQHRDKDRRDCPGGGINHAEKAREDARLIRAAADCEALGISHLWDAVAPVDTNTHRMLRDILASFARCLVEIESEERAA